MIKPARQSVQTTSAAARKHANLPILFLVLDIKLIEMKQRELKVCGRALPEVNLHLDPRHALAENDDESDDHFPSIEELSRAAPSSRISTEALKAGCSLHRLEPPAVDRDGLQVNPTQSRLGECQGICQGTYRLPFTLKTVR